MFTSAVSGRATQADDRFVPTTPTGGAKRAGRQEFGAQRGAMMDEEGAGEEEDNNSTPKLPWRYGQVMMTDVRAEQGMEEPDFAEDGVSGRQTSAISRRRVQREALSVITTQRTISMRRHPVVDETDPEMTFKTLSRATAAVVKPSSRTTATRGE